MKNRVDCRSIHNEISSRCERCKSRFICWTENPAGAFTITGGAVDSIYVTFDKSITVTSDDVLHVTWTITNSHD